MLTAQVNSDSVTDVFQSLMCNLLLLKTRNLRLIKNECWAAKASCLSFTVISKRLHVSQSITGLVKQLQANVKRLGNCKTVMGVLIATINTCRTTSYTFKGVLGRKFTVLNGKWRAILCCTWLFTSLVACFFNSFENLDPANNARTEFDGKWNSTAERLYECANNAEPTSVDQQLTTVFYCCFRRFLASRRRWRSSTNSYWVKPPAWLPLISL